LHSEVIVINYSGPVIALCLALNIISIIDIRYTHTHTHTYIQWMKELMNLWIIEVNMNMFVEGKRINFDEICLLCKLKWETLTNYYNKIY